MNKILVKVKENISTERWYHPGEIYMVNEDEHRSINNLLQSPENFRSLENYDKKRHIHRLRENRLGIKVSDFEKLSEDTGMSNQNLKTLLTEDMEQ